MKPRRYFAYRGRTVCELEILDLVTGDRVRCPGGKRLDESSLADVFANPGLFGGQLIPAGSGADA